jgi:hypothetical protein
MNAHYNGRTGRDFAVWALRGSKNKKKRRKMWVHLVTCGKQVTADCCRRSGNRRSEALLILQCMWTVLKKCKRQLSNLYNQKDINIKKFIPSRERLAVSFKYRSILINQFY